LITMMWSRYSVRMVRTIRSPIAFAFGARGGVRTPVIPSIGQPLVKVGAVIGIPVVDQERRLAPERRGLHHLAPDPHCRRAGRDVEMHPFPALMVEQEEDIEDAVAHGLDHEQVGCPDAAELIA